MAITRPPLHLHAQRTDRAHPRFGQSSPPLRIRLARPPSTIVYSDATPSVTYHYHRDGSLREATSGTYRHVYTYDARLRPQREDIHAHGHHALVRGYATAAPGRYESFELRPGSGGSGTALSRSAYRYDPAGRIDRITSPLYPPPPPPPAPPEPPALPEPPLPHTPVDSSFAYRYLAQSDLIDRITGPAHTVAQTFQPQGMALSSRTHTAAGATVSSYAYRSDSMGRRIRSTWSGASFAEPRSLEYKYDSRGHLTDVLPSTGASLATPGDPVLADTFAFAYDELGNRLTARRGTYAESYTTNLLNQYTGVAVSGAGPPPLLVRTFEHDPDGNLLRDERWTYTWDAENRLVRQQTRSGITPALRIDYTYDHQGRRLTKEVFTLNELGLPNATPQSALLFLYDGWRLLAELDLTVSKTAPPPLRTYTWGLDLSGTLDGAGGIGGLLAVTTHGDTPATAYPTYDGAGNITQWLDASGTVLAHIEYGPFGEILRQRGQAPAPFGFSTKYTDAETGFLYYGFRYYDPRAGRWLSRDPLEEQDGPNLYAFVGNDPLGRFDALGLHGQSTLDVLVDDVLLDSGYWKSVGRNIGTFAYSFGNSFYAGAKALTTDLPALAYQLSKHQLRMLTDKRYRNQFNDIIRVCVSDPSVRAAFYETLKTQFQGALHATLEDLKTEEGIMKALGGLGSIAVGGGALNALKGAGKIGKVVATIANASDEIASFATRKAVAGIRRAGGGLLKEAGFQVENIAYQIGRRTGFDPLGRAFAVDPGRPLRAAENAGFGWVTSMAKGSRPHPSTYMSVVERNAHAVAFKNGASRFMLKAKLQKYGIGQTDGTSFVMGHGEADQLLAKAGGNIRAIEDAIGLPQGALQSNVLMRIDIPAPRKFGLRIPSGNEAGANPQWIAGGKGPHGYFEAVIDAPRMRPGIDYIANEMKF